MSEFTQIYPIFKILIFLLKLVVNVKDLIMLTFQTKFRSNIGLTEKKFEPKFDQIYAKFGFPKNEPNFKLKFVHIRTRINRSKTNLNEFEKNRM
jgi:hypothetical protein